MDSYLLMLFAGFLLVSLVLFFELKVLLKKISFALAVLLIILVMGAGIGYAGSNVNGKLDSFGDDLSKIKQMPIEDFEAKQIINQLPSELKFNKDFEKTNELLKNLEERLEFLKLQNHDLKKENNDLESEIEDLIDEIESLQIKVNAIGVVVGVY